MNNYEINHKGINLGILSTQMSAEETELRYKQFVDSDECDEGGIDEFADWLEQTGHDTESHRFFLDESINID